MDDPELRLLCEIEWPRLVGMLRLYTGDRDLAEDLAQETLARLCRDWHKVAALDAPAAWTARVAMNLARSHFRRLAVARRVRDQQSDARPTTAPEPEPEDALVLRAAVLQLPKRQRAALLLRYFADLPVREVAVAMRCSEGTVKSLTSDARAALRRNAALGQEATDRERSI